MTLDNQTHSTGTAAATPDQELATLERIASLLDDRFQIPGTSIRFGLDPILGLVPGVGDFVAAGSAVYMIYVAGRLGVPLATRIRMVWNVFLDFLVGAVPIFGDVFDLVFKANRRNLDLIRRHLQKTAK